MTTEWLTDAMAMLSSKNAWIVQVFIVVLLTLIANYIATHLLNRLAKQVELTQNLWDDAVVNAARKPLAIAIWVIGFSWAADIVKSLSDAPLFDVIAPVREMAVDAVLLPKVGAPSDIDALTEITGDLPVWAMMETPRADRAAMGQATQQALETNQSGQSAEWSNPDSGHYGSVTPQPAYKNTSGQYCREFQQEVVIDGRTESAYGTACRQPDGSWQIVQG